MKKRWGWRRLLWVFAIVFVVLNWIGFLHAFMFTHMGPMARARMDYARNFTTWERTMFIFLGFKNPRSFSLVKPNRPYSTVYLNSIETLEAWMIPAPAAQKPKGTILLFHGYGSNKAVMLERAYTLNSLGYNTFLLDFMGSGASTGNRTTIGYREAENVKAAYDYVRKTQPGQDIILLGSSMGAVSILKAIPEYGIQPKAIILECPFGSLLQTVKVRFELLHIPTFPVAYMLTFWGGVQNGFNAYKFVPEEYAKAVKVPTLLLYGEKDNKVSRQEIDGIYANLAGPKTLRTYPEAGHNNYLGKYRKQWIEDVSTFLQETQSATGHPQPATVTLVP